MAKHRGKKKGSSRKITAYQAQKQANGNHANTRNTHTTFQEEDPINSFFVAYKNENFDDVVSLKEESNKLRELVSQTLNSNNRYRAEILEAYNVLNRLVSVNTRLHSKDEFEILDERIETRRLDELRFQLANIKILLEKVNYIDEELDTLNQGDISRLNQYLVKHLKISDYLLNNGFLLLKIYYKILNLKNFLSDKVLNFYIKARLLIIYFELYKIDELLDAQKDYSLVKDQQDFKSVLISYKDFILVLINQLNDAIEQRNSEQINECLNILKDVEKMYESFRMNFLFEQELEELQLMENEQAEPITEQPAPPTPQSADSNKQTTTISAELPYLLQAFDEARNIEKDIQTRQIHTPTTNTTTKTILPPTPAHSSSPTPSILTTSLKHNAVSEPQHIHSHLAHTKFGGGVAGTTSGKVGFGNNLLNSIYGINPKGGAAVNHVSQLHNEVD